MARKAMEVPREQLMTDEEVDALILEFTDGRGLPGKEVRLTGKPRGMLFDLGSNSLIPVPVGQGQAAAIIKSLRGGVDKSYQPEPLQAI